MMSIVTISSLTGSSILGNSLSQAYAHHDQVTHSAFPSPFQLLQQVSLRSCFSAIFRSSRLEAYEAELGWGDVIKPAEILLCSTHVRHASRLKISKLATAHRAPAPVATTDCFIASCCSNQPASRVSIEPKREWLAINESYKSIDLSSMALTSSSFPYFIEASSSNVNRLATTIWQSRIQTPRSFW